MKLMIVVIFLTYICVGFFQAVQTQDVECGVQSITMKIYNGTAAELDEFPWMAQLEYERKNGSRTFECAGSVINERYILTAAHCIVGEIEKKVGQVSGVRLGEYNTATNPDCIKIRHFNDCADAVVDYGIEQIIVHENYKKKSRYDRANDIALIRLDRDIEFTPFISPICLPPSDFPVTPVGKTFSVSGWGQTLIALRSDIKLKLGLPSYDFKNCSDTYLKARVRLVESQICAGGIYSQDTCRGDSGGPLMILHNDQWVAEGIVSFGMGCGLEKPGIYTRVSSFIPWINKNMKL